MWLGYAESSSTFIPFNDRSWDVVALDSYWKLRHEIHILTRWVWVPLLFLWSLPSAYFLRIVLTMLILFVFDINHISNYYKYRIWGLRRVYFNDTIISFWIWANPTIFYRMTNNPMELAISYSSHLIRSLRFGKLDQPNKDVQKSSTSRNILFLFN